MRIDAQLLDDLTRQAQSNPRLRQNYDLRTTPEDNSQRMLNALEPGTVLPIHRHRTTTEVLVILRGSATQYFYDDRGEVTEAVTIAVGSDCVGISVEKGRWHRIESLESGTVIMECKDGAYEPISQEDILDEKSALRNAVSCFVEMETRSGSMDPSLITPEYVCHMLGSRYSLEDIGAAMAEM